MKFSTPVIAAVLSLPSFTQAWASDRVFLFPSAAMSRLERRRAAADRTFSKLEEAFARTSPSYKIVTFFPYLRQGIFWLKIIGKRQFYGGQPLKIDSLQGISC